MTERAQCDVLVVGAGMAGLIAAGTLQAQGLAVMVVDKNDYIGGRLATRQLGPGRADSGAQFFTVRDVAFREWLRPWLDDGLVYEWARGWSAGSVTFAAPDGYPRYAVRGGMQALAQSMAGYLDVHLHTRLVALSLVGDGWLALDEYGREIAARAVVMTATAPIARQLLAAGDVPLAPADSDLLASIEYLPCLAGLFWVEGSFQLPEPGAVQRPNAPITWIADNRRKGISPDATIVTVHAGAAYSRELWYAPDWEVLVALESGLLLYKDVNTAILESRVDRWLHATPTVTTDEPCLVAQGLPPLVFAGDAFGGPRIEGAALSGLAAAEALAALVP